MPAQYDDYVSREETLASPASKASPVVPRATNPLGFTTRGLYVGTAGSLVVKMLGSSADVTFANVPAGSILPIRATHVRATSTAAGLVALY